MTKIIKHRKMTGLESSPSPRWFQLGRGDSLSFLLSMVTGRNERIHLCGKLEEMTREWMREPLSQGWKFGREFAFRHRTAVYTKEGDDAHICGVDNCGDKEVAVRLVSHRESWLPGCEDIGIADDAWKALSAEWKSTGLPLLSSPAATGKALLWESLPRDVEFPSLSDDLARLVRANSPQHRIEAVRRYEVDMNAEPFPSPAGCVQYDGRWMYASLCGLDRFPVGEPQRVGHFREYTPGIYDVTIWIPETWAHIGLLPRLEDTGTGYTRAWRYPSEPGLTFRTWAFEPELTLALKHGWEIVGVHDGYAFEKGRPLVNWANRLIEMRDRLQKAEQFPVSGVSEDMMRDYPDVARFYYAAAAIRQILNHTIGAMHKNEYQREAFVSEDNFRKWRRENERLAEGDDVLKVEGGYMVPTFVPDNSRLSIFMPHWSATLYSLARARVAEWALRCEPETLVKIHGDAIYSTVEQPELDKLDTGRLGQPRRKG